MRGDTKQERDGIGVKIRTEYADRLGGRNGEVSAGLALEPALEQWRCIIIVPDVHQPVVLEGQLRIDRRRKPMRIGLQCREASLKLPEEADNVLDNISRIYLFILHGS